MIKELFKQEFEQYGKEFSGYIMENGEYRFRLSSDKSAYIRTESKGYNWQKSHYHTEQTEHFIIEKGVAAFATMRNGQVEIHNYGAGTHFLVEPMIPHNLMLSEEGIAHTVKLGGKPDWVMCKELDEYLDEWKEK